MAFCVYCGTLSEGQFCGTCGQPQPVEALATKKGKLPKVAVLLVSFFTVLLILGTSFIVRQYISPFEGPLQVQINNQMERNNLRRDFYSLSVNGVEVDIPKNNKSLELVQSWESDSVITLELRSRIVAEPDLFFSTVPRELGLLGSDSGKALGLIFTVEQDSFALDLVLDPSGKPEVLQSKKFKRENYEQLLEECNKENGEDVSLALKYANELYASYLVAVREAELNDPGGLPYAVWASRSDKLQGLIKDIRFEAPYYTSDIGLNGWNQLLEAILALEDAWKNFESVARAEQASRWDAAAGKIHDEERFLRDRVESFRGVDILIEMHCLGSVVE
jgi:hypothetical protein